MRKVRSAGRIDLESLRQNDFRRWARHALHGAAIEPLEERRLLSAGDFDPTFGNGGQVLTSPTAPHETITGVAAQSDGKVIESIKDTASGQVGVRRLNSNGTLDTSFASGGTFLFKPLNSIFSTLDDVIVQSDGKIVAAGGIKYPDFTGEFLVVRLTSSGALDTGFSGDGIATASFYNSSYSEAFELLQQPDGKIVAGGNAANHFGIARFNTNGTLDTSFDGDGRTSPLTSQGAQISGIALQSDGEIVAIGSAGGGSIVVSRFSAAGELDTTFGSQGTTLLGGAGVPSGTDVAIQTDGRIVVVGQGARLGQTTAVVARLNSNGTVDTTFGTNGIVQQPTNALITRADDVAILSSGKILVGGNGIGAGSVLERINSNGTVDTTFASAGFANGQLFGNDVASDMFVMSSGKVLIAANGSFPDVYGDSTDGVVRFNADGTTDPTFGANGRAGLDLLGRAGSYYDVAVQSDGKIIAVGETQSLGGGGQDMLVSRYLANGTLDPSFGNGGNVLIDFFGYLDYASSVAIAPDGKIVVAGYAMDGGQTDVATARLTTSGALDSSYSGDGKLADFIPLALTGSGGVAEDVAVQADGKVVVAASSPNFGDTSAAVIRYTAAGVRDSSFASGGVYTFDHDSANDPVLHGISKLVIQSDGKIVVAGQSSAPQNSGRLVWARFTTAGAPDTSFGVGGYSFITDGTFPQVLGLAMENDGSFLITYELDLTTQTVRADHVNASGLSDGNFSIAGGLGLVLAPDQSFYVTGGNNATSSTHEVIHYSAAGVRDASYSNASAGDQVYGNALALQADGKVVEVGTVTIFTASPGPKLAISRFQGVTQAPPPPPPPPPPLGSISGTVFNDGNKDGTFDAGDTALSARVIYIDANNNGKLDSGEVTADANASGVYSFSGLAAGTYIIRRSDTPAGYTYSEPVGGAWTVTLSAGQTVTGKDIGVFLGSGGGGGGSVSIVSGVLTINGTDSADVITVDPGASGSALVKLNGVSSSFPLANFSSILVNANGGDDKVTINNAITEPAKLLGGAGNDSLVGGGGNDTLDGQAGGDTMKGGAGNDTVDYSSRTNGVTVGPGTLSDDGEAGEKDNVATDVETILGGNGNDNLKGTSGANLLVGNGGNDSLQGLDGNDTLDGGLGTDTLDGGSGTDTGINTAGDSLISIENFGGGAGGVNSQIVNRVLIITGTDQADDINVLGEGTQVVVTGGPFNDSDFDSIVINANGGDDKIDVESISGIPISISGGAGNDTVTLVAATASVSGGDGDDTINGGNGDDSINGDAGNDSIMAGAGDDTIDGGTGADFMSGGDGNDTVTYASRTNGVYVGIGTLADDGEAGEKDNVYLDVETVIGGSGNDTIHGGASNNLLVGNGGNDQLFGNFGDDTLSGNAGTDTLNGENGTDTAINSAGDVLVSIENPLS